MKNANWTKFSSLDSRDFTLDDEHRVKLNFCDDEGVFEGGWAWIDPADRQDYDNNVVDPPSKIRIGVSNCSLSVPPGAYFPYRLNGDTRPTCDTTKIKGNVVWNRKPSPE